MDGKPGPVRVLTLSFIYTEAERMLFAFENNLDPDQLALVKPADQDTHCFHPHDEIIHPHDEIILIMKGFLAKRRHVSLNETCILFC